MTDFGATDGSSARVNVSSVACGAFQPITWSVHDTDQTIREIKEHNASYSALCLSMTNR
jgi:hypothetical protein